MIIVIFLAFVAYEILTEAINKLFFHGTIQTPNYLAIIMALIGIVVNIAMTRYIMSIGENINSPAIIADAKHQQTDIFSCIAILIGVILSHTGYPFLDPLIGLVIGIIIVKTAFEVGKNNINNIMGKLPSDEIIEDIEKIVKSIDNVYGIHNVKINYFGSYALLALHVDVNPELSLIESHNLIHYTQNRIKEEIDIIEYVTAHACPLGIKYDPIYEKKQ
ncbi:putative cation efflux system proteinc [Methanobrevibacter filiformis]|uniref:Putative cation efflux system proteinc n=1 Tax=Methanobrevibacter filiformis TaxID=55758 RepID=A0A162FIN3_9EURY|nr:putative cation efflux system proteinc [Methanobrevibacter filiformis]